MEAMLAMKQEPLQGGSAKVPGTNRTQTGGDAAPRAGICRAEFGEVLGVTPVSAQS